MTFSIRKILKYTARYTAAALLTAALAVSAITLCEKITDSRATAYAAMIAEEKRIEEEKRLEEARLGKEALEREMKIEIRIPRCGPMNYLIYSKQCDFSYTNPEQNSCLLKISITRTDTNETVYTSRAVSPGNTIDNISFSPDFNRFGAFPLMIKVDAYAIEEMILLNSMVIDSVVYVQ